MLIPVIQCEPSVGMIMLNFKREGGRWLLTDSVDGSFHLYASFEDVSNLRRELEYRRGSIQPIEYLIARLQINAAVKACTRARVEHKIRQERNLSH